MAAQTKNILVLNSNEAFDFLIKSKQFHSHELQEFFDFGELLDCTAIDGRSYIENTNSTILDT